MSAFPQPKRERRLLSGHEAQETLQITLYQKPISKRRSQDKPMNREILKLNFHYEKIDRKTVAPGKRYYPYRLIRQIEIQTDFRPERAISTKYFHLSEDGLLIIFVGYCWDGATSCPDFASLMRAALGHDVIYQILRELLFFIGKKHDWAEHEKIRKLADKMLIDIAQADGMNWLLRKAVYAGVRTPMAKAAARPEMDVLIAEFLINN